MRPKVKITKKFARDNFPFIIRIGYCNLQFLLYYKSPEYYSVRAEGWACDYYFFEEENILISTGYAPIGISIPWEIIEPYEKRAEKIICEIYKWDEIEKKEEAINELLSAFLKTVNLLRKENRNENMQ